MKRRLLASSTALALASSTAVALSATTASLVLTAGPAHAACTEAGNTYHSISGASSVWKATNLSSSYITGPGSVSITKGRSWTVSASMTASVSAEAGVVFAKASSSLGITVGASYSGTQSFTYTLNVDRGQTMRMQQYKSARQFTVHKYRVVAPCTTQTIYKSSVTAPVASNADQYFKYALVY
ncbi:MAG: hypothetical protein ACTHJJ_13935 [Intrasporangium sp.]|uniref:hypothetical protein n=1 Tax=Intrasporangium sp. TaxID=1925024 RepID=UPI003F7D408C